MTGLVHPVEFLHLQQFPVELDLAEVIHAFPHEILVVRVDPWPQQRTQNKVGIINADDLVLIVTDILPKHPPPLQASLHHVRIVVVFVIAGDN